MLATPAPARTSPFGDYKPIHANDQGAVLPATPAACVQYSNLSEDTSELLKICRGRAAEQPRAEELSPRSPLAEQMTSRPIRAEQLDPAASHTRYLISPYALPQTLLRHLSSSSAASESGDALSTTSSRASSTDSLRGWLRGSRAKASSMSFVEDEEDEVEVKAAEIAASTKMMASPPPCPPLGRSALSCPAAMEQLFYSTHRQRTAELHDYGGWNDYLTPRGACSRLTTHRSSSYTSSASNPYALPQNPFGARRSS